MKVLKVTGSGYWMALPALLAMLALVAYFSFRRILLGQPGEFIGLENYSRMLQAYPQIRRHPGLLSQAG